MTVKNLVLPVYDNPQFYKNFKLQYKTFRKMKNIFETKLKNAYQVFEGIKKLNKLSDIHDYKIYIENELKDIHADTTKIKKLQFPFQNIHYLKKDKYTQIDVEQHYQKHIKWNLLSLYLELELFYDALKIYYLENNKKIHPPKIHINLILFKQKKLKNVLNNFYIYIIENS